MALTMNGPVHAQHDDSRKGSRQAAKQRARRLQPARGTAYGDDVEMRMLNFGHPANICVAKQPSVDSDQLANATRRKRARPSAKKRTPAAAIWTSSRQTRSRPAPR